MLETALAATKPDPEAQGLGDPTELSIWSLGPPAIPMEVLEEAPAHQSH